MRPVVRKIRSLSLDPEVLDQVERTKGQSSASELGNHLLKYALEMERTANLYQETAKFFSTAPDDRRERRAFQKASLPAWSRE